MPTIVTAITVLLTVISYVIGTIFAEQFLRYTATQNEVIKSFSLILPVLCIEYFHHLGSETADHPTRWAERIRASEAVLLWDCGWVLRWDWGWDGCGFDLVSGCGSPDSRFLEARDAIWLAYHIEWGGRTTGQFTAIPGSRKFGSTLDWLCVQLQT